MRSSGASLGLALGGGTARGVAHIGALKVLEERGEIPQVLAGTSYGAIIAALYALGMPALEIERLVRSQNLLELWATGIDFGLHRAALIHGRRLERWLDRKIFFGAAIEECERPLAIACTDLATGELAVLREGSIASAVVASSALPMIFAPRKLDGRTLIDGGFVQAVPFEALRSLKPDRMIGIHAGLVPGESRLLRLLRTVAGSRAGRAWARSSWKLHPRVPLRDLAAGLGCALQSYLKPQLVPEGALLVQTTPPISWWDFHRSPEGIAAGEAAMRVALDRLESGQSGETAPQTVLVRVEPEDA